MAPKNKLLMLNNNISIQKTLQSNFVAISNFMSFFIFDRKKMLFTGDMFCPDSQESVKYTFEQV